MTVSEDRLHEIANMYEQYTSVKALMQATGHGQRTVLKAINKYGTPRASKVSRNDTNLFKKLDEDAAYWLGFIAADGHIRFQPKKHRYELVVEVNKKDELHIDKLLEFVGFGSKFPRKRDDCIVYSFSSKQLVTNLIKWVNPNNKTNLNNFHKIPKLNKKDFVRGYYDGDGSGSASKFCITSCKETLVPVVEYIYENIGEYPRVYKKKNQQAYVACWNKEATQRFRELFNGNIRLERKWI